MVALRPGPLVSLSAMNTDELINDLKARMEALVKRGGDVRAETARLVEEASTKVYQARDGLTNLVKAVADGAMAGAKQTMPDNADNTLKNVVEGVTDGLAKSAQAIRLTLEEATASGSQFAREDLRKVAEDFKMVGEMMMDIVTSAAGTAGGHLKTQAHSLGEHAQKTLQGVRSALESALHAALEDPSKLGHETVKAGTTAVRQGAGVLFTEVGRYLDSIGNKLRK